MISTPDAEAGSGGRLGALEMRRRFPLPAVQAAQVLACLAARREPTDGRWPVFVLSEDAGPSAWALNGGVSRPHNGVQRDERTTTGDGAEQTYKHRARDAGDLADLRH